MRNKSPVKKQQPVMHRKEIQSTLNELHRLQAEIYNLQISESPHSSPPVKKEIKQLAYLYENMTKPKEKNNLDVGLDDIKTALSVLNNGQSSKIQMKKLKALMKDLYNHQFDISLMTQTKGDEVTCEQMYQFINYNDFDNFDPVSEAFNFFADSQGQFDFEKYNKLNAKLGFPEIKNHSSLLAALDVSKIGLEQFRKFATLSQQDKQQFLADK